MTRAEEQLGDLLREIAPEPIRDVTYEAVAHRGREHRRRVRAAVAGSVALVVVVTGGAFALGHGRGTTAPNVANHPSPTPSGGTELPTDPHSVVLNGIAVRIPTGWKQAFPGICGFPADRTVVSNDNNHAVASCPMQPPPTHAPSSITLSDLYGWAYALGWDGTRTTYHGQPAWVATSVDQGVHEATMVLPWLNGGVTTTAPTEAAALALLQTVEVGTQPDLGVPADADSIWLQVFSATQLKVSEVNVTSRVGVTTLLDDISGGVSVKASKACAGDAVGDSATLTVRSGTRFRTFVALFGTCGQVLSGSGHAVTVDSQLRQDIYLLLPKSAPPAPPASGGCDGFGGGGGADGTRAEPTPEAALAAYLATKPAGYPLALRDWMEVAQGVFLARNHGEHAQVIVHPVVPASAGYAVDSASNC